MRSRLSLLLSLPLALVLLTPGVTYSAASFPDVPETHAHAVAIEALKSAGVVAGYDDGTFKPEKPVTRAEALALIMRAAGIAAPATAGSLSFTDVPAEGWFFPYVQRAFTLKKIDGYADKTFRPDNVVILPEALKLLLSFFNVSVKNIDIDTVIYDGLKRGEWYSPYAQYAKNKNIIEPDAQGKIDASLPMNRGQMAELIYRMRESNQTGKAFDITRAWLVDEHAENYWRLKRPAEWHVFKGVKNSVLWSAESERVFFTRIAPKSAQLSISVIENATGISASAYFEEVKKMYREVYEKYDPVFLSTTLGGRTALQVTMKNRRTVDAFIALPDGNFLTIYGEYGEHRVGEFLKKQLEAMLASYEYVAKPLLPSTPVTTLEERLGKLREQILVAGGWKDVESLFPDKKLIHTDAIGIGTGPVDYFYSKEANHTIKLERGTQTILNIREGETSAF